MHLISAQTSSMFRSGLCWCSVTFYRSNHAPLLSPSKHAECTADSLLTKSVVQMWEGTIGLALLTGTQRDALHLISSEVASVQSAAHCGVCQGNAVQLPLLRC